VFELPDTPKSSDVSDASERRDCADATADRILAALVDVILEGGLPNFSVQEIANRAGVSHRTVYRCFPTRASLLAGLSEAADLRMERDGGFTVDDLHSLDDVPAAILKNYELFSQNARTLEAAIRFGVGAAIETPNRIRRTDRFRELVASEMPHIATTEASAIAAFLRQALSSRTWLGLREVGVTDENSAAVAAWAGAVLVDAIRDGRLPGREPVSSPGRSAVTES